MTTVDREKFILTLESVSPGLSPKEIIEQSNAFIFRGGEVLTYNDEVACRARSGLEDKFQGAVAAGRIMEQLRKWKEEEIRVEPRDNDLMVMGKRKRAAFTLDKEISLPVDSIELPKKWKPLPDGFTDAVKTTGQCAGANQAEFETTCVHLHPEWVEATDRFQFCRWPLATGLDESFLVRQTALRHLASIQADEFGETDGWLHFRAKGQGTVLSCRRYLEEYPDLSKLMKLKGEPAILPKGLAEAAERAAVFASESADNPYVQIELRPAKLRIKGQGVSGWYQEARKVKYNGPAMSFVIAPGMLADIVRKHNDCQIGQDHLIVNGGAYTYVSCLMRHSEKEQGDDSPDRKKKPREDDE